MARQISDIYAQITSTWVTNAAAAGLTTPDPSTWGMFNKRRLWANTIAFCIWVLETLFDVFTANVNTALAQLTPHRLQWYANTAKAFQYGFELPADTDTYNNTGYTDAQVTASLIVAFAAVVEQTDNFGHIYLRIKVAATNGTNLIPLTSDQLTAFTAYIQRVKDAGVKVIVTSGNPDSIKQAWRIYYDPLVFNANGNRLDGTSSTPVQDAINSYLANLPFNGLYEIQKNIDAVQAVQGVDSLDLDSCQTQYGLLPFTNVDTFYTPDAGYLSFAQPTDLAIAFIPFNG